VPTPTKCKKMGFERIALQAVEFCAALRKLQICSTFFVDTLHPVEEHGIWRTEVEESGDRRVGRYPIRAISKSAKLIQNRKNSPPIAPAPHRLASSRLFLLLACRSSRPES